MQLEIPDVPDDIYRAYESIEKLVLSGNASAVSKLRKIYDLVDRIAASIQPYTVCVKGCSHCCFIDVGVLFVEAQYIQMNLGIRADPGVSWSENYVGKGIPCNFLSREGTCTVYAHRPFACRTFHAFDDPKYCADNSAHATYTGKSHPLLIKISVVLESLNQDRPIRDIRDFFPAMKTEGSEYD